jgi:hypothetical protein
MPNHGHKQLISHAFDKMHEQLTVIRLHLDTLDDPEASRLFDAMERGLLVPLRKLRLHLEIPYDWHEYHTKQASAGASDDRDEEEIFEWPEPGINEPSAAHAW